jgi:hypothetical protein
MDSEGQPVLDNYSRIRLLTNRYREYGVPAGAIGYILEVYGHEAYEVEFSDKNGITIAQFAVPQQDIELAPADSSNPLVPPVA